MTFYDLLLSSPDDQTIRLKNAWKDVAAGDWKGAAHWLRNTSRDGTTVWHDECAVLAIEYENK
jgi:hypothetical protein